MTRLIKSIYELSKWRSQLPHGSSIGFVPTMGALHEGHLSLLTESLKNNSHSVLSIFVNPTQFGPNEDFNSYPRTLDTDLELLNKHVVDNKHCDVVFAPNIEEMYPNLRNSTTNNNKNSGTIVQVLGLSDKLEGKSRPGFFTGVATVVLKFFNLVKPTNSYFGQKDVQQSIIIKNMVNDLFLSFDNKINVLPIVREPNGLAKSSRNKYLTEENKAKCSEIYKSMAECEAAFRSLCDSAGAAAQHGIGRDFFVDKITSDLGKSGLFSIDYISIADKTTLDELSFISRDDGAILSIAVNINQSPPVRLIDNIVL